MADAQRYREYLKEEYGEEWLRKTDEATMRMQAEGESFGPTGNCPECGGPLIYLLRQDVHYCAMCDIKYKDVDAYGKPTGEGIHGS